MALLCPVLSFGQQTSVYFESAADKITLNEEGNIEKFIKKLPRDLKYFDFILTGHTDNVGNEEYNKQLSRNRCRSVKDFLLNQGIRSNQLFYKAESFESPAVSNETYEGKAKNRRVELKVLPAGSLSDATVQVPIEKICFNAEEGLEWSYDRSGTKITISSGVLVYSDGSAVEGEVELNYREFRDAADFVSTDIPMMYNHDHQFESAGMFEINAYQGGNRVFVRKDKNIEVEFMMTSDEVEDVGFYEYRNNKWKALGALDRESQNNTFEVNNDCRDVYNYPMPELTDTLTQFTDAMKVGYFLSGESNIAEFYKIGFLNSEQRFADKRYEGNRIIAGDEKNIDWNVILQNPLVAPIKFSYNKTFVKHKKNEVVIKRGLWMEFIKNNENRNLLNSPELIEISDRVWKIMPNGKCTAEEYKKMTARIDGKFIDIRVSYLRGNEFQFIMKKAPGGDINFGDISVVSGTGKVVFDTINAQMVFRKDEKMNHASICKKIIDDYNVALTNRNLALNTKMLFYKNNWKAFLSFSKALMPAEETCMDILNWLSYFNNRKATMAERYYPFTGLENNQIDFIRLIPKAVAGTRIYLENPPLPPSRRMAQGLNLNGFGTFNCDAIRRIGQNYKTIAANFVDENKNPLDIKIINVIDESINGIVRFYNPEFISFNPDNKTKMMIIDFEGNTYVMDSAEVTSKKFINNKMYTLNVSKVAINNVGNVRNAIAAN